MVKALPTWNGCVVNWRKSFYVKERSVFLASWRGGKFLSEFLLDMLECLISFARSGVPFFSHKKVLCTIPRSQCSALGLELCLSNSCFIAQVFFFWPKAGFILAKVFCPDILFKISREVGLTLSHYTSIWHSDLCRCEGMESCNDGLRFVLFIPTPAYNSPMMCMVT